MSTSYKVYGIAVKTSQCYGHGDFGQEERICRMGGWGSGAFPPLFATHELAAAHIKKMTEESRELVVVELTLQIE